MANLKDMEELLASIESGQIKEYMREAMGCYMADACRGCIVLSYIALFDDLLEKLGELGKVNKTAKKIFVNASTKKQDQEVFESFLIDQLSAEKLLPSLDATFLDILRTIRNKSAHPSGHKPSSEEARFVFAEIITRFLSRPILSTTQLVDELISRLENENFFPTALVTDVREVVEDEIQKLHPEAVPQLVARLVAAVHSTDQTTARNAGHFLIGLARLDDVQIGAELSRKLLKEKSDDSAYANVILRVISADGSLVSKFPKTIIKRIKKILSNRIDEIKASDAETRFAHPTSVLASLASCLPEEQLVEFFSDELEELFIKRPYSSYLIKAIKDHPVIRQKYVEVLIEKAGSATYDTANSFARAVEGIADALAKTLTAKEAFRLVGAVIRAAEWNAFASKDLVNAKFSGVPGVKKLALKYVKSNQKAAEAYLNDELHLDISVPNLVTDYLG